MLHQILQESQHKDEISNKDRSIFSLGCTGPAKLGTECKRTRMCMSLTVLIINAVTFWHMMLYFGDILLGRSSNSETHYLARGYIERMLFTLEYRGILAMPGRHYSKH